MIDTIDSILKSDSLDDHASWSLVPEEVTSAQVEQELSRLPGHFSLQRLTRLVSPAAEAYLETMALQAQHLTLRRFGRTIQLYAPLYVSNICTNMCRYCGYNQSHTIERRRLSIAEAIADAEVIAEEGFRHILLVSGEDKKHVTIDYLCELAGLLRARFSSISIEIYPLTQDEYKQLFDAGIDGVALYQETYDRASYSVYHPAGPKMDYDNRLNVPDRFAAAGMRYLGLGFLLGLSDWRIETLALGRHAAYLMKKYWRAKIDFSFPRIRPAIEVQDQWPHLVSDTNLVQMMLALRLCFADAGVVLSTRESADFRDHMINLCVTRMSAGSKTNPGGYSGHNTSAEQFEIADDRSPHEIADVICLRGYEAVWKDWDASFTK